MYTKCLNFAPFRQPYQGGVHNFLSRVVLRFALIDRAPVYERVAIIPILLTAELVTNFHTEHHYHSCILKRVKGQGRSTQFSIQQSV